MLSIPFSITKVEFYQSDGFTSPSALVLTPATALISVLAPAPVISNKLFKQFIKFYLKSNHKPSQSSVESEQLFKAKVPVVYYDKSHIDYHYLC